MSLKKNVDRIKNFSMIFNSIDELVPQNHIVRKYEACIDWNFIYDVVGDLYSNIGAPSVDPVVLFKMVMLNYLEGIHSMRKTCEKSETDIAYRWFLGLDFSEKIPNHSTYSQNYARKFAGTKVCEEIFNKIIEALLYAKMIDCSTVFGDATHVKANANKKKHKDVVVKEISRVYQEELTHDINKDRIEHNKKPLIIEEDVDIEEVKTDELLKNSESEEIVEIIKNDDNKIIKYKTYNAETGEIHIRNNKEYKRIKQSLTDSDSGFYHKGEHEKIFAYSASAFCDKHGYVLSLFVDSANKHDSITFFSLYNKLKKSSFFKDIKTVCLDAGYFNPAIVREIINSNKLPLLPYVRPKTKDGFFKKNDYVYDEHYDCYICPNNKVLEYSTTNKLGYREYKSCPEDCINCPFKKQCTESKNNTKIIIRHVWEDYLEQAHDIRYTIGMSEEYAHRKETIERCFADGKEKHGLRFTRYTGKDRVKDSLYLTFACMNLKKMARRMNNDSSDFNTIHLLLSFIEYFSSLIY